VSRDARVNSLLERISEAAEKGLYWNAAALGLELQRRLMELLHDSVHAGPRCVLCGKPSPRLDPAGVCAACRMPAQVPPPEE
jgi:hypothetical protein